MNVRNLTADYLHQAAPLQPFYKYPISDPDFSQVMADKVFPDTNREVLSQTLKRQYEGYDLPPALQTHLEELAQPGTFTITTGHQLGLMGGPLFTLYKVACVIRMAEEVRAKYPGSRVVPVFWIHTEDHDFEEINHFYEGFGKKRTYAEAFGTAVGKHLLADSVLDLIPAHFPDELRTAYQPGKTLAQATREFFHALFGAYGLVILDPDDAAFKGLFRDVLREEFRTHVTRDRVDEVSAKMAAAGYATQIQARDINLFYLDTRGRHRMVSEGGNFKVLERNLHLEAGEVMQLIQDHPERFSPNVSLRPLFQEMILPNLAYVGGWGEISYWLQLKGVFDHFGVNFPLVLPRFSATLFPGEMLDSWLEMGFGAADIRLSLSELYRRHLPDLWNREGYDQHVGAIDAALEALEHYISTEISPTLSRSVEALKAKNLRYLSNLEKKIGRVIRSDRPAPFREIERIKNAVQPDGFVQERTLSLAAFPGHSPHNLVALIMAHCRPLDFQHQFLRLD